MDIGCKKPCNIVPVILAIGIQCHGISAIFIKEDNFRDFLFASLDEEALPKLSLFFLLLFFSLCRKEGG